MKYTILILLILASVLYSCKKCVTCEIIGKQSDSTIFSDTNNVVFDEFCGTSSEIEAFEDDIKFLAERRKCVTFNILQLPDSNILSSTLICGNSDIINKHSLYIDTLINTTFEDYEVVIDTSVIMNPASWSCN